MAETDFQRKEQEIQGDMKRMINGIEVIIPEVQAGTEPAFRFLGGQIKK
jgi:hypothetical protein